MSWPEALVAAVAICAAAYVMTHCSFEVKFKDPPTVKDTPAEAADE